MPVEVTYPGVYIQELPSGQHTVSPVSTSITAFIGRAPIGPTDEPRTIFNFGDFQRTYGGLDFDCPLSYTVRDFFSNGGSEAVIARLFEPLPGKGSGVAQLKFAPPPPILPSGWMVDASIKAKATTILVAPPSEGDEGSPDVGLMVTINDDKTQQYTVIKYEPPKKGTTAGTMEVVPALTADFKQCTTLKFDYGASPAGWVANGSGTSLKLTQGSGIPELGDTLTIGDDATAYTIISEPAVSGKDPLNLTVEVTVTPKVTAIDAFNNKVVVNTPMPMKMPVNWEIMAQQDASDFKNDTGTVTLVNGENKPLAGDHFTVGDHATVYIVTSYTAKTDKAPASVAFKTIGGVPASVSDFCLCCPLRFTRPAPTDFTIFKGPKIGETSFTYGTTSASEGVIDIGDTFIVAGDNLVYTVRYVDEATNTIYFLPVADTAFSGDITFYPPLALEAANPGIWGNRLKVKADTDGITEFTAKQFAQYDLTAADLFNITVSLENAQGKVQTTERFLNLSVKNTGVSSRFPNRIDRVLEHQSSLIRVSELSAMPPANGASSAGINGNDGTYLETKTYLGHQANKTGIYMLDNVPIFNLLSIPPDHRILPTVPTADQDLDELVRQVAAEYCADRRAFYIVDPPAAWTDKANQGEVSEINPTDVGISGENKDGIEVERNAAVFFPRIWQEDTQMKNQPAVFAPSGAIAGIFAATDVSRGVWKTPAGTEAGLANVTSLEVNLTNDQNGQLNPLGINCLRTFPTIGSVVWGGRTLRGADAFEDDYKYISVRRLTLFIEQSLMQSTQWAVFEPNDEALWSSLRSEINSFLAGLSRQGAFYSYKVVCDATTTTQTDIERGIVNVLVQIAPVDPAEFVVIQIQQIAGGVAS